MRSAGFQDLLHIGNQARPAIFDLAVACPGVLYETVVPVPERVVLDPTHGDRVGVTGERLRVATPLDLAALRPRLAAVRAQGITSLAVVLVHSYLWGDHEEQVGALAADLGFTHVSLSSRVMRMVKLVRCARARVCSRDRWRPPWAAGGSSDLHSSPAVRWRQVPRGYTTCADAYLTPCIAEYLRGFAQGFAGGLARLNVLFMQSDGGLVRLSIAMPRACPRFYICLSSTRTGPFMSGFA